MNRIADGHLAGAADLHFHLLPGVDDGPDTLEESVALARRAAEQGTRTIVATPHVRSQFLTDVSDLEERVAEVAGALSQAGTDVELRCGGELGHDMVGRLHQEDFETIAQGPADGRWLLVEAPFEGMANGFHEATDELRDRGFALVIAHPERTADASLDDSVGMRREIARGALAQVNAQSLTGDHGEESQREARRMVAQGLIHLVASDAHGPTRPPSLVAARQCLLANGCSASLARTLTLSAPRRLLARGARADQRLAA